MIHSSCQACGSSDALADYGDHTFCFSCRTRSGKSVGEPSGSPSVSHKDLIPSDLLEFKRLQVRGISVETCKRFNYSVTITKPRKHVAAYYSKEGILVAQKCRTEDKTFFVNGSIARAVLFGQPLWRNHDGKRLVITEGELDCLSVAQAFNLNWPVVSVPTGAQGAKKALKENLEFLESFQEVVLWFDNDEAGHKATEECSSLFTPGKLKIAQRLEGLKDANEVLQRQGPGSVCKCVWDAQVYRPDGILSGKDLHDRLLSYRNGDGGGVSFDTPYPLLNQKIRGLRKKRLYTVIAAPKVGKSTLVKELGYSLMMDHGLKVASFAIEESVEETGMIFMGMYLKNRLNLNPKGVSNEQFDQAERAVVDNGRLFVFDHFGSLDPDNLLSKFRYMAVGLGVDFILFDHVSMVVSGSKASEDERRLIDRIETCLRSLIQETGVGVIQVAHIKKGKGDTQDPEEGGKVTASDIRGSGSISQISDFVIALEGDTQDDSNRRKLRVIYNRLSGDAGECDALEYSRETGRLLPMTI